MMRRNVDTTLTARVCQIGSLALILIMVLGMLAHDIYRNGDRADAGPSGVAKPSQLVVLP